MAAAGGVGGGPGSSERDPGWEVAVRPLLSASYSAFEMRELPQLLASVIERWEGGGAGLQPSPRPPGWKGGRSGGEGLRGWASSRRKTPPPFCTAAPQTSPSGLPRLDSF